MKSIPKSTVEKSLNIKLEENLFSLGIDTASRTGWCVVEVTTNVVKFDYGFIDIKSKDKYYLYNQLIETFKTIIEPNYRVVIEETFYGQNVKVFQFLSRIGAMVYTLCHEMGVKIKYFVSAAQARKALGFKGNAKKTIIHEQFKLKLPVLDIDDEDIIDAIILALVGVLKRDTLAIEE